MMTKRGLILVLSMMLLFTAAAAENTVEILPTAAPMPDLVLENNPYAFEDLSAYYEGEWEYQTPALTALEKERFSDAQGRWDEGERPGSSILNLTENVQVALIQLPAEQYEGESWFLILPNREMTDTELLQLADAYGQLGIIFDPGMVSWHNCMRGGGIEHALRSFREEESERYSSIGGQFIRSGLRPKTPFTASVMDDGLGFVTLDEETFNGLGGFTFYPARRLTDEELLQLYALRNKEPAAEPDEMARYENQIRQEMHDLLGMPLSAIRSNEESVHPANESNVYGDERIGYYTSFTEVGGTGRRWSGGIDISTGKLIEASVTLDDRYYTNPKMISDILMDPWDTRWAEIARTTVSSLREDQGAGIVSVYNWCEATLNDLIASEVRVSTDEGNVYRVRIAYIFEKAMRVEYKDATAIACEDNYYHSMEKKEGTVNE